MPPLRVFGILAACQLLNFVLAGVSPSSAPACVNCPKNEVYSKCGNNGCQNTCANPNFAKVCKGICTPGCVCAVGYLRNSKGVCVVPEKCYSCKANEIFSKCDNHGCQNTCAEPDLITRCDYLPGCYPGCICKPGFLRDPSGKCICESLCKCGENEQYSETGKTICENTCKDPRKSTMCKAEAEPGCGCKEGYLRNEEGQCVLPEDCGGCGGDPNAQFNVCGDPCPPTCNNPNRLLCGLCLAEGGCKCKEGYLRNIRGRCVLPCDCPKCGPNEVFACGSACDTTCATLGDVCPIVNIKCNEKCYCINGYARDKNNVCIPIKQCPPKYKCSKNQKYNACPMYCPPEETCEDYIEGRVYDCAVEPETRVCLPRCECKMGYIRKIANGDCIKPESCCDDPNAEVVECPNPCPGGTCESPEFADCKAPCRLRGCQCKKGYVKDSNGKCILLSKCQIACDDPNAELVDCPNICPGGTCEQPEFSLCPQRACLGSENRGCQCKTGYVKDSNGKCILLSQCPAERSSPNGVFQECGTRCPATCDNRKPICTRECVPSCFCKDGFILHNGECISLEKCPPRCKDNEVFQERPSPCSPERCCARMFSGLEPWCPI